MAALPAAFAPPAGRVDASLLSPPSAAADIPVADEPEGDCGIGALASFRLTPDRFFTGPEE
jgi:hypothetical protein